MCCVLAVAAWLPLAVGAGEAEAEAPVKPAAKAVAKPAVAAEAVPAPGPKPPFAGEVTGERVYVRAGDGVNYTVLTVADRGMRVDVRGRRFEWLRIAVPANCTLWVHKDLLTPDAEGKTATVAKDRVNMRARSSLKTDVVGQLARGEQVSLRDSDGDWLGIAPTASASAWVHGRFVAKAAAAEEGPPERAKPKDAIGREEALGVFREARRLYQAELAKPAAQRNFNAVMAAYQKVATKCEDAAVAAQAERARQRLLKIVDLHQGLRDAGKPVAEFQRKYEKLEAEYKRRAEQAGKPKAEE